MKMKSDFVPGEKVVGFDDFSQDSIRAGAIA
jgi:hypothetical protein